MSNSFFMIARLERQLANGETEHISFEPGVNLLVGRPNTGKTRWLQTFDYLVGGDNPFEDAEEEGLSDKYISACLEAVIGEEPIKLERRWREPGLKTKVFVNGEGKSVSEAQQLLMEKLSIPLLNFPRGNPYSGQTWPELSFRTLLRHIYRQQRFWSGIVDKQPEGDQQACLMQFLGIAERLYTEELGKLVKLKMDVDRLKARREQYGQTLDDLARDVLTEPGLSANTMSIRNAENRLAQEVENLREKRIKIITAIRDKTVVADTHNRVNQLGEERAEALVSLEGLQYKAKAVVDRLDEIRNYRDELANELVRFSRAEDAGTILADLKITHCPACDQSVSKVTVENGQCFLCHQSLPDEPSIEGLGTVRLQFERDRISGELKEAESLLGVFEKDAKRLSREIMLAEERLAMLDSEIAPTRMAVSVLVQEDVSSIDMALGQLSEKQRQLGRVSAASEIGQQLTDQVADIESEIKPLQEDVTEVARGTDFGVAASLLEDGMNSYLDAINVLKPGIWRHSSVSVQLSQSSFAIRIGKRRWHSALGGTDTLYFLMAYNYGLLTLSGKRGCHYPGLSIIDVPGEFSGEDVEDKENFIVQPFCDLLDQDEYRGAQLIITGASFTGLENVHRNRLEEVYVAR